MNYLKPEILALLAGEYVLGTLHGAARRRFETLMAKEPSVQLEVYRWQERLQPLAARLHTVEPPDRVWENIHARTRRQVEPAPVAPKTVIRKSAPKLVSAWWKGWAVASTACAALLLAVLVSRPAGWEPTIPGAKDDWRLWSVLVSPKRDAQVVVVADTTQSRLWVIWGQAQQVAANKRLELWLIPPDGVPHSLGVMPTQGVQRISVPLALRTQLAPPAVMAVTLEPVGGAPHAKPSGPVLYSGPLVTRPAM